MATFNPGQIYPANLTESVLQRNIQEMQAINAMTQIISPPTEAPPLLWSHLKVGDKFQMDGKVFKVTRVTRNRSYIEPKLDGENYVGRAPVPIGDDPVLSLVRPKKKNSVDFDSVILQQHKKDAIMAAIKQIDHHDLIFKEWGFEATFEKGTAISMLFYGPPGTGKTLMAQAIADRFSYELKIISTAEIETPEPGGAERAIKAAFKESEGSKNTVLLFDECDSLVSSRKHMGSILAAQVNALLTCLEHYKGIVVFTTNRLEALDEAFDRRLSLKLEFEMPDEAHRAKIWKRMFPKKAPLAEDVSFEQLATVEIAGGHIKNVVLKAARMAASLDVPKKEKRITQAILIDALAQEVRSNVAYTEALKDEPIYGTPIMSRGKGRRQISG